MPWDHCGQQLADNMTCPACGYTKPSHTVAFSRTRLFVLGAQKPWDGDGDAQAKTLRAAHDGAVPLCETCKCK